MNANEMEEENSTKNEKTDKKYMVSKKKQNFDFIKEESESDSSDGSIKGNQKGNNNSDDSEY